MSVSETIEQELKERFISLSKPMAPLETGTEPKLENPGDIRVIMYDFYGTLFLSGVGDIGIDDGVSDARLMLDAMAGAGVSVIDDGAGIRCFEAYNEVVNHEMEKLKKSGIEYPEPDIRKVWGNVLQLLFDEGMIESVPDAETQSRMSVEFEARMNPVWPVNGAVETLLHFKAMGLIQGIISNSQFYTPIVLEALSGKNLSRLGLSSRLLHWSFEERMKKPGLLFYENAWKKIKAVAPAIKPAEVLYAGNDMLKDIWPASELGFKTALFAGDSRSLKWRKDDARCQNLQPDIVFTEFSQLREIIG
jgi:putative hydrolase of the HAD superfamily